MKRYMLWLMVAVLAAGSMFLTACEWSSGNDAGFNTSEGAGANINFSGYYQGLNGGRAVKNSSAGNIVTLTIQQGGDTVEVTDNQGSSYKGKIGSPGAVSSSSGGSYPAGAELAQAQINFSGHDNVSAKNISFAGVIHAVAVQDITGTKTTDTSTDTDTSSRTRTDNETWTTNITVGSTGTEIVTTITIIGYNAAGDEVFRSVQTTTTTPGGTVITDNKTVTDNRTATTTESDTKTTTDTITYQLTEANTQYRLQGTWIEEGGATANVDALSSGTSGLITTTTTTP